MALTPGGAFYPNGPTISGLKYNPQTGAPNTSYVVGTSDTDLVPMTQGYVSRSSPGTTRAQSIASILGTYVANVRDQKFAGGAKGDGVTDDAPAIQAASTYLHSIGGGVLFFPPAPGGSYLTGTFIKVPSNTIVRGSGIPSMVIGKASFVKAGNNTCSLFINWNAAAFGNNVSMKPADVYIDNDITYENMAKSFVNLQNIPGGGTFGLLNVLVKRTRAVNCYQVYGNDHVAHVDCYDTLCEGCQSYQIENAGYDHWAGSKKVKVIGCTSIGNVDGSGSGPANGVLFNAGDGSLSDTRTSQDCVIVGNTFTGDIGIDSIGTNCIVDVVTIVGNTLYGGTVIGRGTVTNTKIIGNHFTGGGTYQNMGEPIIWIDQGAAAGPGWTGNPANTMVANNTFININTYAGNLGAVRIYDPTCIVHDNFMTGTYPIAIYLTNGGIQYNNQAQAGSVATFSGGTGQVQPITVKSGYSGMNFIDSGNWFFSIVASGNLLAVQGLDANLVDNT